MSSYYNFVQQPQNSVMVAGVGYLFNVKNIGDF